ncbi:MAG: hypothetical protein HN478_17155 [Rhodospirillaceae bacterium]|nr:hypothetical protein [Rhodospirillaceae bacterium]MBT4490039.1 hypothetical protein [Rhodospirillaceae bacterium]MBT5195371.1 hypothetical protein [Rhodospirillaceae bacterium]MBT5897422.1 hypothetical protein [Rhodospirillaceae bacterium]MBT6428345.1 hypothetical protein [Rhodospirillaceae bacterium]
MPVNDFTPYLNSFDGLAPFDGYVEKGFLVDFIGQLTDAKFRDAWGVDPETVGDNHAHTKWPSLSDGELWFETFNWFAAAREARGSYTMMTLGSCYGGQAVGSYLALQALNPMPAMLVAVDGIPQNMVRTRGQLRNNGINPDEHWMIEAAMSGDNSPVLFPIGAPGLGAQSCTQCNSPAARMTILDMAKQNGTVEHLAQSLLLRNSTGLTVNLEEGTELEAPAEIAFVSALTLNDLLAPFARVDYVEADLQESEGLVFPPAMDQLTKKVRRVHLGTHSDLTHEVLEGQFRERGWDILFSYLPRRTYETPHATFEMLDGVITAVNPALAYA